MRTKVSLAALAVAALVAAVALAACAMPDTAITAGVKAKLAMDEAVRGSGIEVETSAGEVTLTGNVETQEIRERALQLAREASGVVAVHDMMAVRMAETLGDAPEPDRTAGTRVDDVAITARVKSRLLSDPLVKGMSIDVDTRAGVVFLTGSVKSAVERDAAIRLAKDTQGVREVQANIHIGSI